MRKWHIVGADGYIAGCLLPKIPKDVNVICYTQSGADGSIPLELTDLKNSDFDEIGSGDYVVFLAAISSPDVCRDRYEYAYSINVTGTKRFIEECVARGANVLFFSSDVVVGATQKAACENAEPHAFGNYGAMKRDRIWKVLIYSTIQVTVVGILIAQLELLFAYPLASLFIEEGAAAKEVIIEQAIIVMKAILTFYFICGIYGVLAGFIRGLGNSTGPMITAVSTVLAVRSIWIYVFFPMHADRIDWLMLCYPITWIITILMNLVILAFTAKKIRRIFKAAEAKT